MKKAAQIALTTALILNMTFALFVLHLTITKGICYGAAALAAFALFAIKDNK